MRRTQIRVKETEVRERLFPLVIGRVFHVTRQENLEAILNAGCISQNSEGRLVSTFGSAENSYFRKRGCVSLFDLAHPEAAEIDDYLDRCWPFQPATPLSGIAILMLRPDAYGALIPFSRSRVEGALSDMIVPYVEAGFEGDLPLSDIEEIIEAEIEEVPDSLRALMRGRQPNARMLGM